MAVGFPSPTPILPTLNGFSVHKKPTYASMSATTVSGREITVANQAFPLWEFELTYEVLREQTQNQIIDANKAPHIELERISQFFLANSGQYGRFFYDDPTDNSRTGQMIGTGDGVTTVFRAYRTVGFGNFAFTEPVGGIRVATAFYLDGIPQILSAWEVTEDLSSIRCINGLIPPPGVVASLDFSYYYFCRFIEDIMDFDQFYHNLWALRSFKFRSVKV